MAVSVFRAGNLQAWVSRFGTRTLPVDDQGLDWLEPVAPPGTVARLEAEVASLQTRISDFEKYTEIMCPDCGAPTDGLPDGWPAS
jgi:hypothetical protein